MYVDTENFLARVGVEEVGADCYCRRLAEDSYRHLPEVNRSKNLGADSFHLILGPSTIPLCRLLGDMNRFPGTDLAVARLLQDIAGCNPAGSADTAVDTALGIVVYTAHQKSAALPGTARGEIRHARLWPRSLPRELLRAEASSRRAVETARGEIAFRE